MSCFMTFFIGTGSATLWATTTFLHHPTGGKGANVGK